MKRHLMAAMVATTVAGCTTAPSLTVRPTGTALAEGAQSASFRLNEAQAHLALGNVALAAEGFRRALRVDPNSVAAMTGLAACYERMGRSDLSRTHYERALALRPADSSILTSFASFLERAGARADAASVRREVAARASSSAGEVTGLAALVRALDEGKSSLLTWSGHTVRSTPSPAALRGQNSRRSGPRLERADLGEVVLVTTKAPHWAARPLPIGLAKSATPVRVEQAPAVRITILNAGTVDGVASRTRTRLQKLGWTTIAIANAGRQLDRSELHYPASLEGEGKRIARFLPVQVRAIRSTTVDRIVLRLGRDAGHRDGRT